MGTFPLVHAQLHENRRETGRNEERIRSMLQVRRISGWKTGNGERKREEATGIEIDCGLWPSLDELWMMREAAVSTNKKRISHAGRACRGDSYPEITLFDSNPPPAQGDALDRRDVAQHDQHRAHQQERGDRIAGEDDRRDGVARHGQRQHRDQRAADTGVVGGFAGHDALHSALAKGRLRMLDQALGLVVGEEGCHGAARARQRAHERAQHGGIQRELPGTQHVAQADVLMAHALDRLAHVPVEDDAEHLGKAEQAYQRGHRADAGAQLRNAEDQPRRAHQRVETDHADDQAQRRGDQALDIVLRGDGADRRQAEQREQEVIHRPEPDRQIGHRLGQQRQRRQAEHAADERVDRRDIQRLVGLPPARERVAVQRRHDGGGRAGDVDQNRGDRAAEHADDVDAHDHRQRVVRLPGVGDGDEQRRGHGDGEPGNCADKQAGDRAQKHEKDEFHAQNGKNTTLRSNEAKRKGRHVQLRPDWEDVKLSIMEEVVRAKFTQNEDLKALLLATGDSVLEEGNTWHDIFWGVDARTRKGENHLGRILMQVREELRSE